MRCLDLRCNKITSESLRSISQLNCLTQLSLSNNDIGDSYLDSLEQLSGLLYLDITSNKITEKGGLAIAKIKTLNNLYLSHNKVTISCVEAYFMMPSIRVLDVRFNDIPQEQKDSLRQ